MFSDVERGIFVLWEAVARGREKHTVEVRERKAPTREQIKHARLQRATTMVSSGEDSSELPSMAGLCVEELEYKTEDGPQGWVPLMLVTPERTENIRELPTAILLHPTGANKEHMLPMMVDLAREGFLTASIDCRYHGERVTAGLNSRESYAGSLVKAWHSEEEHPYLLDNVWDLLHLVDLLDSRQDVDSKRIGMLGISLGGTHTWLCACLDERIQAAAVLIGAQNFGWAVDHNQYDGRVSSIPDVFDAAAESLNANTVDKNVVQAVWDKLLPGLKYYDAPFSLPALAPRPLLIINGELDERCPIEGLKTVMDAVKKIYRFHMADDCFTYKIEKGLGHKVTPDMLSATCAWIAQHL